MDKLSIYWEWKGGEGMGQREPKAKRPLFRRAVPDLRAEERRQVQESLEAVRQSLNRAYAAFNMADDADWVEACVFEINALQARYNYLVRQAKALEGPCPAAGAAALTGTPGRV